MTQENLRGLTLDEIKIVADIDQNRRNIQTQQVAKVLEAQGIAPEIAKTIAETSNLESQIRERETLLPGRVEQQGAQTGLLVEQANDLRALRDARVDDLLATTKGRAALANLQRASADEIRTLLDPRSRLIGAQADAALALAGLRGVETSKLRQILPFATSDLISQISLRGAQEQGILGQEQRAQDLAPGAITAQRLGNARTGAQVNQIIAETQEISLNAASSRALQASQGALADVSAERIARLTDPQMRALETGIKLDEARTEELVARIGDRVTLQDGSTIPTQDYLSFLSSEARLKRQQSVDAANAANRRAIRNESAEAAASRRVRESGKAEEAIKTEKKKVAITFIDQFNSNSEKPYIYVVDTGEGFFNLAGDPIKVELGRLSNGQQLSAREVYNAARGKNMTVEQYVDEVLRPRGLVK